MGISDRRIEQALELRLSGPEYRYPRSVLPNLVRAADLAAAGLAGLAGALAAAGPETGLRDCALAAAMIAAGHAVLAGWRGHYEIGAIMRPLDRAAGLALCLFGACGLFVAAALLFRVPAPPWALALAAGAAAFPALMAARIGLSRLFGALWRRGVIGSSLVVLGAGKPGARLLRRLQDGMPPLATLAGLFDAGYPEGAAELSGQPVLGGLDELIAHARARKIDDVAIAMPWSDEARVGEVIERLKELPVNLHLCVDPGGHPAAAGQGSGGFGALSALQIARRPIEGWGAAAKSASDYVLASLALILISPLLAVIAAAIRLDTPGPVFFKQNRLGYNNKPFAIYKFRSMHHQAVPESVVRQARKGDPRVTRVGRFIRATSLDELPQLFNVLNGTMSLVGPRPHAMSHNEEYGQKIRGYFARHRVRPGITGWSQVNGLRGETEALELMEARVRHDIHYADNWSLMFDLRILVMTVMFVFFQKTAY